MLDWREIHREATIVDLHIHPSMQQQLFHRNLGIRYVIRRTFHGNPLTVRSSFPRLHSGGYDAILSAVFVPEHGILRDFPLVNIFRFLRPDLWRKLVNQPPLDATLEIMNDMEKAVAQSTSAAPIKMACSVADLDAILAQPKGPRPIAVVHCVEGGHSLGDQQASDEEILRSLEILYQRGVAYLTLAHFYPNRLAHPSYPFPEDIARLSAHPALWRDLTEGLTPLGARAWSSG